MTQYFNYAELNWLEVAQLPRDTPLVLPLVEDFAPERLSEALSHPTLVGVLPRLPFGWMGSLLPVPEKILTALVINLLDSLRDDGFTRVYAILPHDLNLGLGAQAITVPASNLNLGSALQNINPRGKVLIAPIGHTEQHGHHLPLSTDTLIIDAIAAGITKANPENAVRLPVMPYGVSTHRPSFAGTLNSGGRAFEDFWGAIIDQLVWRGFEHLYLISGHGGNSSFLVNIVKYAGERHRRIFCATAWLYLSGPAGIASLEQHRRSPIGGMGHACELETSLILHLRPDLVRMDRVVDELDFVSTPAYFMDWVEGGALVANPPWDDDTATGAYGAGSLATAKHGAIWLQAAIDEKNIHVMEILEQQARREARRTSGFGLWGLSN